MLFLRSSLILYVDESPQTAIGMCGFFLFLCSSAEGAFSLKRSRKRFSGFCFSRSSFFFFFNFLNLLLIVFTFTTKLLLNFNSINAFVVPAVQWRSFWMKIAFGNPKFFHIYCFFVTFFHICLNFCDLKVINEMQRTL